MFERDYLMRLILGYLHTVVLAIRKQDKEKDPQAAADMLEQAIGQAVDMDVDLLLSLAPESVAGLLQVSGTDPKLVGYIANGLLLESHYLMCALDLAKAELREQQARALAAAYGIALPDDPSDAEGALQSAADQAEGGQDDAAAPIIQAAAEADSDADSASRFDADAPLQKPELHEGGLFGWQDR